MAVMSLLTLVSWALINLVAFAAFEHDKGQAIANGRRVPESDLLALALCGGALGALLGQQVFRHKTRKQPFRSNLIAAALVNLAVAALVLLPDLRAFAIGLVTG